MSSIAAVWMLLATPRPAARWAAGVELEPIEPGEWDAWAKALPAGAPAEAGREAGALIVGRSSRRPIPPRGIALRLRP
jgi:hypothetical protein